VCVGESCTLLFTIIVSALSVLKGLSHIREYTGDDSSNVEHNGHMAKELPELFEVFVQELIFAFCATD
jgi:hypothetical protein